ncbi:MAG: spore germination protein [Clostridiales bacterium]|jgi:spore germination protein KA|nr:spore germination protein [Clostridiales bacterium]
MINFDSIRQHLDSPSDLASRQVVIGDNIELTIVYIEGLVSSDQMSFVLTPILRASVYSGLDNKDILVTIQTRVLPQAKVLVVDTLNDALMQLLLGCVVLTLPNCDIAVCVDLRGVQMRGVSESSENIIKGSKDCFVESFRLNTALLRAHYRSTELSIREIVVGQSVQTVVALCYNREHADLDMVDAIKTKIEAFGKRGIFSSADLEDHLSRHKNKVFPHMTYSERPDKVAANINEGKIAIIIDNLPYVYIVPATFSMMMQAVEDYSRNYIVASFTRILRYSAFFIATILPSFYIAVMLFHHEMIPRDLAISLIASKEGVAFPTPFEVFFMLMAFEILVEAGLRMPKAVGPAASIVGGLVVGQAAVTASFISSSVVVIVALTAIAGYTTPDQDLGNAIKIWRMVLALLACLTGFYGLVLGLLAMLACMSRMEFMHESFLRPFVNTGGTFLKRDTIIRNTR